MTFIGAEISSDPLLAPMETPPVAAKGTCVPDTDEMLVVFPPKTNDSACCEFQSFGWMTSDAAIDDVVPPFQMVSVPVAGDTVRLLACVMSTGEPSSGDGAVS